MFGEKNFKQLGYPTPTDTPAEFTELVIQVPDNPAWWAIYLGVIETLTDPEIWQQLEGGISREEAAGIALDIFIQAVDCATTLGGCMDCCDETGAYDPPPDRDYQVVDDVPQISYDGGTTWSDIPTGPGVPHVPPRIKIAGDTDDQKRCNASVNATNAIAELYRLTFGQVSANVLNTVNDIMQFLWQVENTLFDIVIDLYTGITESSVFLGDYPYTTDFTEATLTDDNKDDLRCLLFNNSTVDNGYVVFDYDLIFDNLISDIGANPGIALSLLLPFIAREGLNRAGDVGGSTGADCADCTSDQTLSVNSNGTASFTSFETITGETYEISWSGTFESDRNATPAQIDDGFYYSDNLGVTWNVASARLQYRLASSGSWSDFTRPAQDDDGYALTVTGNGEAVYLQIYDGNYDDNSGALSVRVRLL